MLNDKENKQIECLQATALCYISGFGLSYRQMQEKFGLPILCQRRMNMCDKFDMNMASNP